MRPDWSRPPCALKQGARGAVSCTDGRLPAQQRPLIAQGRQRDVVSTEASGQQFGFSIFPSGMVVRQRMV